LTPVATGSPLQDTVGELILNTEMKRSKRVIIDILTLISSSLDLCVKLVELANSKGRRYEQSVLHLSGAQADSEGLDLVYRLLQLVVYPLSPTSCRWGFLSFYRPWPLKDRSPGGEDSGHYLSRIGYSFLYPFCYSPLSA
jgi:hypothetical protein